MTTPNLTGRLVVEVPCAHCEDSGQVGYNTSGGVVHGPCSRCIGGVQHIEPADFCAQRGEHGPWVTMVEQVGHYYEPVSSVGRDHKVLPRNVRCLYCQRTAAECAAPEGGAS